MEKSLLTLPYEAPYLEEVDLSRYQCVTGSVDPSDPSHQQESPGEEAEEED